MQAPENWFRDWFDSPYYHKLYIDRNVDEAAAFITRLVDHLQPAAGARMLDVACGRGRHARILADGKFDVTGIDLSPHSIAYALHFASERLHFYEHDMRRPFWINYFDYAFNFFTSFGYFRTQREHDDAIRTISQSLKSKGGFVLDYLNVQHARENLIPESLKKIGQVNFHLTRWADDTHLYKKIVVEDERLHGPLQFIEKVALFTLQDFEKMFSRQGLEIKETLGDYQLNPFNLENSPRLLLVAVKKV
jgi:SAM-dependent methyltransferase